ncbi:Crossover junction endonuclease mus81 [Entomophthora muscae]|uniref:Crossover junction endonuclease mus81 n=1 Tax=Entomophthora muscae TaxID=34485 RepID=A0ACC2ST05_9FUNG|nr:Crossover junction endonuclease mus81 [Entomophthora muscae]
MRTCSDKLPQPGCGNPLFLNWIKEWHSQVQGINKNYAYTLKKAIDALSKYPLPLEAKETIQLNGIGPKIAAKLEQKWQEHLKENPLLAPTSSTVVTENTEGSSVFVSLPSEASSITEPSLQTKSKSTLS